jgi:hypothetical protein
MDSPSVHHTGQLNTVLINCCYKHEATNWSKPEAAAAAVAAAVSGFSCTASGAAAAVSSSRPIRLGLDLEAALFFLRQKSKAKATSETESGWLAGCSSPLIAKEREREPRRRSRGRAM